MTYFQCSVTGKGNTVIVTCDSAFAGLVVTLTNGTKTYTKTCPSSSPYEIEFHGIEAGTWTVSAVESGVTYSSTFLVKNGVALLAHGFNWRTWVSEGGLDPDDYNDLDDVFDDEAAVRRLMLIHDSVDYLIACVTEKLNDIDAFCANDTAMKWIGLCDYVCDGLEAIDGVVAKFLASDYWERYLKDHVPIMTSHTAPYGEASASSTLSSDYYPYKAFNGIAGTGADTNRWVATSNTFGTSARLIYKFATPFKSNKMLIRGCHEYSVAEEARATTFHVQGSNDGSTWTELTSKSMTAEEVRSDQQYAFENDNYYLYYSIYFDSAVIYGGTSGGVAYYYAQCRTLQFYGRAMSVSVPKMTSNTAPYGVVSSNSVLTSSFEPWKAFNKTLGSSEDGNRWVAQANNGFGTNARLSYKFPNKVKINNIMIRCCYNSGYEQGLATVLHVQGSNDGTEWDNLLTQSMTVSDVISTKYYSFENENRYLYYSIYFESAVIYGGTSGGVAYYYTQCRKLDFYGRDYSEKEFESGTNAVWLHDHGLDLATLTTAGTAVIGDEQITLSAANDQASKVVDLTDYSLIRAKVGDHMSGTTQIIASTTAVATLNANDAPNANGLNVSAVNQELDTGVKMTSAGTCDILELWLE